MKKLVLSITIDMVSFISETVREREKIGKGTKSFYAKSSSTDIPRKFNIRRTHNISFIKVCECSLFKYIHWNRACNIFQFIWDNYTSLRWNVMILSRNANKAHTDQSTLRVFWLCPNWKDSKTLTLSVVKIFSAECMLWIQLVSSSVFYSMW